MDQIDRPEVTGTSALKIHLPCCSLRAVLANTNKYEQFPLASDFFESCWSDQKLQIEHPSIRSMLLCGSTRSSLCISTMSAIMFYILAVMATLSTFIVAILNGVAYASSQSLPDSTSTMRQAPLSLSVITCVALIVLSLFLHKDVRGDQQWPEWKLGLFYFTGVYLLIAAASSSATMTTDNLSSGLGASRSILWALSLLAQGQYFGFLLVNSNQKTPAPIWPTSYSQELPRSDSPSTITPPQAALDPGPRAGFDTRRSSLRKFPRRSARYSGGTLCLQNTNEPKYNSFDTSSSTISSPEPSPTHSHMSNTTIERDTRPLLRGNGSIRSMPSLRHERVQHSLDSLVQTSPTTSTFHLDSPSASTLTLPEAREQNIHPLFRSTSPVPSPTPTPGTMVKASPSAGQTITKNTLTRMRSNRSLRTPSPLPGSEESMTGLAPVHTGPIRRSRSMTQYEQRYELNESPEEK